MTDFILGGSKITADGNFKHEIKRHLFLGRKVMTNLDSILKSRDITLPTKVRLVKAMVISFIYECRIIGQSYGQLYKIKTILQVDYMIDSLKYDMS